MVKAIGLLSPVIVPLILAGILFFSSEKKNIAKLYLAAYMLLIWFVFAANFYYFEHNMKVYSLLHSLHIATVLAIYPGAFVYVKLLTGKHNKGRKLWIHFMPSLIFLLLSGLIFYPFLSYNERIYFLTEYRYHPDFSDFWLKFLYGVRVANVFMLFVQVVLYPVLTYNVLRRYRKRINDLFSNPEKYQLNWLRLFNLSLALSAFICVFIYTVSPQKLFGDERFLAYPLMLIAMILWFLGIMGNNQKFIHIEQQDSSQANSIKTDPDESLLVAQLLQLFEKEKLYLNPELKIWDVARKVGSNRTYVSQTINTQFNQNFAAFVNSFRVKEARRILKEEPDIATTDLAARCGFGSTITMNRAFKEFTGNAVSRFRKTTTA